MKIDTIRAQNFKSISDVEVEFNDLNILIGKNAAGKSNFLELFQFVKDISEHGLEDAIQLRGGVEYFRNTRIGTSKPFILECEFSSTKSKRRLPVDVGENGFRISDVRSIQYYLEIGFSNAEFHVEEERMVELRNLDEINDDGELINTYRIWQNTSRRDGEVISRSEVEDDVVSLDDHFGTPPWMEGAKLSPTQSLLSLSPSPARTFYKSGPVLTNIEIYDIDPGKIKKGTTLKGKKELEEDGENLPLVLKEIIDSDQEKQKFLNLIGDVLPFVMDWETETQRDQSIFLKILEEYEGENEYLPANLVSDGTIQIIAIIIILYFEKRDIVMIEEPERNIHPSLISRIVQMMRDVTKNTEKQVFTTSHNAELIKNSDLKDILLVSRDEAGFTTINRPDSNERVKKFLEQGMGIEELYVKDLLDGEQ